jgi:hypothetical protein
MKPFACITAFATFLLAGLVGLPAPSDAAEELTVNAFSVWQADGRLLQTGETAATYIGVLYGPFFIETEDGPRESGQMVCPATLEIDLESGKQQGNGKCTFTAHDGAQVYAQWNCKGVHLLGCDGEFTITAGTARLAGLTGMGPMSVRGSFHELAIQPGQPTLVSAARGIAIWRDLQMAMP